MAFHDSPRNTFVMCRLNEPLPPDPLAHFNRYLLPPLDQADEEIKMGWSGYNHFLDLPLEPANGMVGRYPYMHLTTMIKQIPSGLLKSYVRAREMVYLRERNAKVIPREEKKRIKGEVKAELLSIVPPTVRGFPFLIDVDNDIIYFGGSTAKQVDYFTKLFYETTGRAPTPLSPDNLIEHYFDIHIADLPAIQFTKDPVQRSEERTPGRDFTTWLWFYITKKGGLINLPELGEFMFEVDGPLTFAGEGPGSMETVARKGAPTLSPEAKTALLVGKKLKTLG
ncbi:MAG: hypothetical protein D6820_08675, partial [Lentisphaerae bacterium]